MPLAAANKCVVVTCLSDVDDQPTTLGDQFNRPHERRRRILAALGLARASAPGRSSSPSGLIRATGATEGVGVAGTDDVAGGSAGMADVMSSSVSPDATESEFVLVDVAAPEAPDFTAASLAHAPELVSFLATAWRRWVELGARRDISFFLDHDFEDDGYDGRASSVVSDAPASAAGGGSGATTHEVTRSAADRVPALAPANAPNRDNLQRPGRSVMAQACYFMADRFTPVYGGLAESLGRDMAIVEAGVAALVERESEHFDAGADPDRRVVYALVTHPGHHASATSIAGYCYLNNAAIAARLLQSRHGLRRVAIVDVDYHAGNGTVSVFWGDPSVFVTSIHMDPDLDYPFNCCYADQTGGPGAEGTTLNCVLPARAPWEDPADVRGAALRDEARRATREAEEAKAEALAAAVAAEDPFAIAGAAAGPTASGTAGVAGGAGGSSPGGGSRAGAASGATSGLPATDARDGECEGSNVTHKTYKAALEAAVAAVRAFGADALVVSLGVDTYEHDVVVLPGAGFALRTADYREVGAVLSRVRLPTIVVQEGGYLLDAVGDCVAGLLQGLCTGEGRPPSLAAPKAPPAG